MRSCKVYRFNKDKQVKEFHREAVFHQFGMAFEEFENGGVGYTTAIVEYSDGRIDNVPVENIKFNNPLE